jgi:hypothetical protein
MMKKIMVTSAFVLTFLLALIGCLGLFSSNAAHANTTSTTHVYARATALPEAPPPGTPTRVFNCRGGDDGFFNILADNGSNWDCFANAGYGDVEIWGASMLCPGDNTGYVVLDDNDGRHYVYANERFHCVLLGEGLHHVSGIIIR